MTKQELKDKLLNTHGAKHIHMLHWAAPKKIEDFIAEADKLRQEKV